MSNVLTFFFSEGHCKVQFVFSEDFCIDSCTFAGIYCDFPRKLRQICFRHNKCRCVLNSSSQSKADLVKEISLRLFSFILQQRITYQQICGRKTAFYVFFFHFRMKGHTPKSQVIHCLGRWHVSKELREVLGWRPGSGRGRHTVGRSIEVKSCQASIHADQKHQRQFSFTKDTAHKYLVCFTSLQRTLVLFCCQSKEQKSLVRTKWQDKKLFPSPESRTLKTNRKLSYWQQIPLFSEVVTCEIEVVSQRLVQVINFFPFPQID